MQFLIPGFLLYLQENLYYFVSYINTLQTKKSILFTILFIHALNWAIDVLVADWRSQAHVNFS